MRSGDPEPDEPGEDEPGSDAPPPPQGPSIPDEGRGEPGRPPLTE